MKHGHLLVVGCHGRKAYVRARSSSGFVNTNDIEGGRERFPSPGALRDWLADEDLLGPDVVVRDADLAAAIELREALRALAAAHNGLPADVDAATATVNAVAARAALLPRLTAGGASELEPGGAGVDAALGRIVADVHAAVAQGVWVRFQGVRARQLPLGVLRPLEEPIGAVVPLGSVRQPRAQPPRLPAPPRSRPALGPARDIDRWKHFG